VNKVSGFTLVELMVSLALGVTMSWVVLDLSLTAMRNSQDIRATAELMEKGRYVSDLLRREIKLAGFYGRLVSNDLAPASAPVDCLDSALVLEAPIVFQNNALTLCSLPLAAPVFIDILDYGTDVLVIQRASTVPTDAASLTDGTLYVKSNFSKMLVAMGDVILADELITGETETRQYFQDRYYVDEDHNFVRKRSGLEPVETLVTGIDDFQVAVWTLAPEGGDMSWQSSSELDPDQWAAVSKVKIWLLMSVENAGVQDNKSYQYNDLVDSYEINPGDIRERKRRLFTFVVPLDNADG
jgi:prepilin-type N-terminal cleavage/methylation domain-containing protein|tara:strand:+ start:5855 stop:6748 length:894 start_codon:yes stop_codon:yes gene_type:complete